MQPELAIFIGLQASGKSTYYRTQLAATHVHVSKDRMPNARNRDRRQLELIHAALRDGKSVVVDNTNPTPAIRAELIAGTRTWRACRCLFFRECGARLRRTQSQT